MNTCVSVTNIGPTGATMSARFGVKCAVKVKELVKEKETIKERKELKEPRKEFFKDIKEFKEKERKEFKEAKEIKEKERKEFKEVKEIKEIREKPGEGGGGGFGARAVKPAAPEPLAELSGRVEALEEFVRTLEPFISVNLRPDLEASALQEEDDVAEIRNQMSEGSAAAKRLYDTKSSDR
jgi:hypothetical protein